MIFYNAPSISQVLVDPNQIQCFDLRSRIEMGSNKPKNHLTILSLSSFVDIDPMHLTHPVVLDYTMPFYFLLPMIMRLMGQSHKMDQALFDMMHSSRPS